MRLHSSHRESMLRMAILVVLLVIGAALALPFSVVSGMRGVAGYQPLHMLFETFAIVVSMLIFAVGWHAYNRNLPGNIVLLACAFFGVGLLDFAHMLSYAGMPDFVTPGGPEKAIDFWLVARSLAAVALLAAVVMPWRPFATAATRYALFAAVAAATALAYWLILFHQDGMPSTFIPGQGLTAFKIAAEYTIIALNLAAALALWVRMREPLPFDAAALFGALCAMALSEFFFTIYASVTDVFNLMGHVYKVIAYLLLYRAFFLAIIEMPYRRQHLSESKLRGTLDAIPDLVWLKDPGGVYLECNAMTRRFFGAGKADIAGKTDYDFLDRDLADFLREHDRKAIAAGKPCINEEWLTSAGDGRPVLFETVKTPMYDDAGKLIGVLGIARDITERKRAEEALRRSEARLHAIYDSTSDAVLLLDEQGFFDCNTAALAMFGCASREELCSKHLADLSPPQQPCGADSMTLASRRIATAMATGCHQFEWVHKRADTGLSFLADVLLNSMVLGKTVLQATVRDITERKNNEAKIERLSQTYWLLSRVNEAIVRARDRSLLFEAICNAAMEPGLFRLVWIGMVDKNEHRVIPMASSGMEDGYTSGFNIRLDDEKCRDWPVVTAIRENTHVIRQNIENDPALAIWRDEALKRGYQSAGMFPVREAGVVAGTINAYAAEAHFFTPDIIGLMLDLAADVSFALDVFAEKQRREQAEDEIRRINIELECRVKERTRQLEAANKELEAFSYSVSHDLRAPLRSIDGFSRVLAKNYRDQLDATGRDWLERICRASQRMGCLIDDMLQLAQVTRGPLRLEQVDLSKMAEAVADDLRKTSPGRQVRFVVQQGLSAQADPGLMRAVMDNLLGNAYKFTGRKPAAEIEFGACDSLSCTEEASTFFVRDNGEGFSMEYVHKLFGAFQRLHGVNEFEGTGIGLATVQRVIRRHNGKVWAEAVEGRGATFYFTLPQAGNMRGIINE